METLTEAFKCEHCGVDLSEHNYEHLARECYPKQIAKLKLRLSQVASWRVADSVMYEGRIKELETGIY